MDAIKTEPKIDPLAVQPCDDAIKEEKNPSPDEGNLLDLHVTRIKEECVDESYDHNPEIKFQEIILPNNFPVVKCETEKESCNLDRVKEELDLEVATEEKEISPHRFGDNIEKTESSECDRFAGDEDRVTLSGSSTRQFKCDVCGKCMSNARNLERHTRLHRDRRKFNCHVCGKNFSNAGYLKIHIRLHTDRSKCNCDICGENVSDAEDLKRHIRLHTGRSEFNCDYVEKVFQRRKD